MDGYIFPPNFKRIPPEAETTAHNYIHDFYAQYKEWYKAAVKASRVAFDRAKVIAERDVDIAKQKRIIQVLQSEVETSRKSELDTLKKHEGVVAKLARMQQEHCATVEEMGHRNTTVAAERDLAVKELNELKAKFAEMVKEKDDANATAQEACDQAVSLRAELAAAAVKAKSVEAEIQEKILEERSRLDAEFDDLLVTYNANVLEHRNLAWLGDDSMILYNAWTRLVNEKRAAHLDGALDDFELEMRLLTEDERKTLHEVVISMAKERLGVQSLETGEGSGTAHHEASVGAVIPTLPETTGAVDPQSVPAYNPDQPLLSSADDSTHVSVQTKEGI